MTKRKARGEAQRQKKRSNVASELDVSQRSLVARLAGACSPETVTVRQFHALLRAAEVEVGESTIFRYAAASTKGTPVFSLDKKTGRQRALTGLQEDLLLGFVENQNQTRMRVTRGGARAFVRDVLGVTMTKQSIGRYFKRLKVSRKKEKKRTRGYPKDESALVGEYMVFVKTVRVNNHHGKLIGSIDFTFTGHRTDVSYTYSPVGCEPVQSRNKISDYTNCIVTCVWSDGVNRTPAVLYTYNAAFRSDSKGSHHHKARKLAKLKAVCEDTGIPADRVVYIGKEKGERRTYVAESAQLLSLFFGKYHDEIPDDAIFYSDNGGAYLTKENGEDVDLITHLGYTHEFYPADVHQWLSPNDNALHGVAKNRWRNKFDDFKDDVKVCVWLLKFLDDATVSHSKGWFTKNLFLDGKVVRYVDVAARIRGQTVKEVERRRECWRKYCKKVNIAIPKTPRAISRIK
jgi:transposase